MVQCVRLSAAAFLLCVVSLSLPNNSFAVSIVRLTGGESQSGLQSSGTTFSAGPIATGIDFAGDFSNLTDIISGGSYRLSGVQGSNNPLGNGQLAQATHSGVIEVFGHSNELLLRGNIGNGNIAVNGTQATFSSSEVTFFEGELGQRFLGAANLALNFEGIPTAHFETQTSFESVFNGYTNGAVTGYTQVQTGTHEEFAGYRQEQYGTETYQIGTEQVYGGTVTTQIGQHLIGYNYGGWVVPVDSFGHIVADIFGKWFLLGSTPTPTPEYAPDFAEIPFYNTVPVFATRPLFRDVPIYNTVPTYAQQPIYAQVPTYIQVPHYTQIQTGWDFNSRFANGVITGTSPVPEPTSMLLLSMGVIGLGFKRRSLKESSID